MIPDLDIYCSARNNLRRVARRGDGAPLRAAVRAKRFRKAGEGEGAAVCREGR